MDNNAALVLGLLFLAGLLSFFYLGLLEKILRSDKAEAAEGKWVIGKFSDFLCGCVAHPPRVFDGDYRTTRGLSAKKVNGKVVISMQSTLSAEKYRAIFNR